MESKDKRMLDTLAPKFTDSNRAECLILKSPSDVGVRRNKGRNGARFAPQAIENAFKKLNNHFNSISFKSKSVSNQGAEVKSYPEAIGNSSDLIASSFKDFQSPTIFHLGGGHDHALPMLKALERESDNILIINFDAHCDTRIDEQAHSGTPFRDFDQESKIPFHLLQIGIHLYANSAETIQPLKRNSMKIVYSDQTHSIDDHESFIDTVFSTCPFTINEKTSLFISLDCDAVSSSIMSGVSAVNHNGLEPRLLMKWIPALKDFPCARKVFGIYEYNPVYDDLSQKGARYLAGLMFKYLEADNF